VGTSGELGKDSIVTGELSPEDAERYFERLERELSADRRDLAARIHIHRAGHRLQYAFALTRGAGRYEEVTTGSCEDVSELQSTLHRYAEEVWTSLFPEEG
jgi:hypothetical protein